MKPEDCPKLNECPKVMVVLDKDLLGFQYAEAIRAVCANCSEVRGVPTVTKLEEVRMTAGGRNNDLGKILKQRRVMIPLTLMELAATTDVSASHLARIEMGQRYPSARVLRKLAEPLGFDEDELFVLASYLTPPSSTEPSPGSGRLDPYVARVLSEEPIETQRSLVAILSLLKSVVKG